MENNKTLNERLEELRTLTGLSKEDFSVKLGLSRSYYGKILDGTKKPGAKFFAGILKAYPRLRKLVIENMVKEETKC